MSKDLTEFIESVVPETHLRVEQDLGDGFVVLRREEAERRQAAQDVRSSEDILIELLRNARDAKATRIYIATGLEAGVRTFVVADNGCGIPAHMTDMIFMPRVTSKLDTVHMDKWGIHGRGMALYSIRENCIESRVCSSDVGLGSAILTRSELSQLPEKSDQSSFPQFTLQENGTVKISGAKNILRTTAEFALEHRNQISVYIGSATEIAATMVAYGISTYSLAELSLKPASDTVPLIDRPAFAHSPAQLCETLEALGLSLSERSCRRIIDGEIEPLCPMHELVRDAMCAQTQQEIKPKVRKAPVRTQPLSASDLRCLEDDVSVAFAHLAEKYYLDASVRPTARKKGDQLSISIPLVAQEE